MDGYAVKLADIQVGADTPISGEALPGNPPPAMVDGAVVKIFTGAIVPPGADAVVRREDTQESHRSIRFLAAATSTARGTNVRLVGENLRSGEVFLRAGSLLASPQCAALRTFGVHRTSVFNNVRVAVLTTGDELVGDDACDVQPWQIRNSNQVALQSILSRPGWLAQPTILHALDREDQLQHTLGAAVEQHDAVILSGGVSAGDRDYVPQVVRRLGGDVVFHKLPIRPGKPILAAVTPAGKLIVGLPGNPVSATMGCVRFVMPWLARISGQTDWCDRPPTVLLEDAGGKTLPLHWMRGVRMIASGVATPVVGRGSGDSVSLAATDGFIEMPPGATGKGPWPYWSW